MHYPHNPYGQQPAQPQTGPHGMPQIPVGQTPGLPYHPPEQLIPQIPGNRANYARLKQTLGLVMWQLESLANKEPHIQNLYLACSNGGRGYGGPMFVELVAKAFYYVYDVEMNTKMQGGQFGNEDTNNCVGWIINTIGFLEAANHQDLMAFIKSVPEWAEAASGYLNAWGEVRQRIQFAQTALTNEERMAGGGGPSYGYGGHTYGGAPYGGAGGGYGNPGYGGGYPPAGNAPPSYTQAPYGGYGNHGAHYGRGPSPVAGNGASPIAGAHNSPVASNSPYSHTPGDELGLSSTRYDDGMDEFLKDDEPESH